MSALLTRYAAPLLIGVGATLGVGLGASSAAADPVPDSSGSSATTSARHPIIRAWYAGLTDTQRQCLKDHGVSAPTTPMTPAERKAFLDQVSGGLKACDIQGPFAQRRADLKAFWQGLTDDQRTCLKERVDLKPRALLSREERATQRSAIKAAAQGCNVTLPPRG